MSKVLIIDADSWAYSMAHFHNLESMNNTFDAIDSEDEAEFEGTVKSWAREAIKKELDRWLSITKCKYYQLHLSVGQDKLAQAFEMTTGAPPKPNFRYAVANDLEHAYKHNRPTESLEGADHVLNVMAMEFNSFMHDEWEADDYVVALKRDLQDEVQLCAIDKDVLNQVEGIHFNYRNLEPVVTDSWTVIRYPYWQALVGDPGDGYKGVKGVGKAKADKLFDELTQTTPEEYEQKLWRTVCSQYKIKGMSYKEAVATMRLASMNQLHLSSQGSYELQLWQPPIDLEW